MFGRYFGKKNCMLLKSILFYHQFAGHHVAEGVDGGDASLSLG